jgi:TrpR family transcriptional regulator, trp operon repressor
MRNPHAKIGEREKMEVIRLLELAGKEQGTMKKITVDLLTPAELNEIIVRWQIVKRLAKGESHRTIAQELHIGIATVLRGARALENGAGGFLWMLKKTS